MFQEPDYKYHILNISLNPHKTSKSYILFPSHVAEEEAKMEK